jgi:hypothetical protein
VSAPVQLLFPVNVPATVEFVTPLADPLTVALQVGEEEIDPIGMLIVNESDVPAIVPASVPRKPTNPLWLVAVTDADTLVPA